MDSRLDFTLEEFFLSFFNFFSERFY